MGTTAYSGSPAADRASEHFNSLPREERAKLAPLLEHYRQMGLAEALRHFDLAVGRVNSRIRQLQGGER